MLLDLTLILYDLFVYMYKCTQNEEVMANNKTTLPPYLALMLLTASAVF